MAKRVDPGKGKTSSPSRAFGSERTTGGHLQPARLAVSWHQALLPAAARWLADQRQWPESPASSSQQAASSSALPPASFETSAAGGPGSNGPGSNLHRADSVLVVLPSRRARTRLRYLLQRRFTGSARAADVTEAWGDAAAAPAERVAGAGPAGAGRAGVGRAGVGEVHSVDGIECLTVGELAGRLVQGHHRVASPWEQTLAWSAALKESGPDQVRRLVPVPPAEDAVTAWVDLGNLLRRLHAQLAAEALSFDDVLERAQTDADRQRWRWFADLRRRYMTLLQEAGLSDLNELAFHFSGPDERHAAADDRAREPEAGRPRLCVVLVGVTDLSPLLQRLLTRCHVPVYPLVSCPDGDLAGFDRWGNVHPPYWSTHHVPLDNSQLVPASDVEDQVRAVAEVLSDFGQRYRIDQVAVGVTDESQVQPLETHSRLLQVPTYRYLGYTLRETAVGRLLDLIVAWLQRRSWRTLASLVRHADVFRWISGQLPGEAWLSALDRFLADSFPHHLDAPLPESSGDAPLASRVRDLVNDWLSPLHDGRQPIGQWSRVLREVLASLYPSLGATEEPPNPSGTTGDASDTRTDAAVAVLRDWLKATESLTQSLDPPVGGPEAIEMLAARSVESRVPQQVNENPLRIFGWLDLVLEDTPALVVCGLNHPFVPEPVTSDPFLPVDLRRELNQLGNDRRYARDVHALHQMLAMRKDVRLIVGTHAADGSPTPPSRLVGACDATSTARRVVHLQTHQRPAVDVIPGDRAASETTVDPAIYQPPPPVVAEAVQVLSVTSFSSYLSCPYRFYLRHVLNLRPLDDAALELAANQFGDLIHNTLEDYGKSDAKDLTDADEIREALVERLHHRAYLHYGEHPSMTVRLQVRQAEQRLGFVATAQAERMAAGWRIFAAEKSVDEKTIDRDTGSPKRPTGITVDGRFVGLRGRFDRIDFNERTNQWAILDYKTHRFPPEKKHRKKVDGKVQWVDLQLPLYRRVVPDLGIPADPDEVQLGYFNVAEKASDTKVNVADFSAAELAEADELILWCVRQILAGQFQPTEGRVDFDDYEDLMNQKASSAMYRDLDASESGEGDGE